MKNKKISVITMHRIYNYGSILQTYATQVLFEKHGFEVEIIDYISPFRTKKHVFLDYPPKIGNSKLKRMLYYCGKIPSLVLKDITFGKFMKKYINLSKVAYITNEDLINNPPKADVFCVGSDQVWNSKYNHGVDKSYFLNFASSNSEKIAFVSSFGADSLTVDETQTIYQLLKDFKAISVREEDAKKIIESMNIKNAIWLIDPTLQIGRDEWMQLAAPRKVKERYLLLFLLYNEDAGATKFAKDIANKKGLKLIKLSWELTKNKNIDRLFTHRSPSVFLSLFSHADFIVTNSFHGVAFSINFNRQFVFVPRSEFNSRIESLLNLTGLEKRKVCKENYLSVSDEVIVYDNVNRIITSERNRAQEFIKGI